MSAPPVGHDGTVPGRHRGLDALPNPVMTASGTSGHGDRARRLRRPGRARRGRREVAVGRPVAREPRASGARGRRAGMLNSVGLQGPGLAAWAATTCPPLRAAGARVVVSIWGRTVADYARPRPAGRAAVATDAGRAHRRRRGQRQLPERGGPLAHVRPLGRQRRPRVLAATACGVPRWAKLSPNVPDLVEIAAGAARRPGADGLTLVNTLLGMALDIESGRPVLGAGGGGLSGPALHPVAVRAVWECRAAFPETPIVGVGGVSTGQRRARAAARRGRRRPGGHGHVPRPACPVEGAAPAGAVVRRHTTVRRVSELRHDRRSVHGCRALQQRVGHGGAGDGPAVRRHRSLGRLLRDVGSDRRRRGAGRLLPDCVEAFAGCVAVGQAPGGLLRAARLGRLGRARATHRRRVGRRPRGHRRRQARRHRHHGGGLRRRMARGPQPAGRRRGDGTPVPGLGALAPLVRRASARAGGSWSSCGAPTPKGGPCRRRSRPGACRSRTCSCRRSPPGTGTAEVVPGTVGAVVGATLEPSGFALSQVGGVILAPGLGAQGAAPADRGRPLRRAAPRAACCPASLAVAAPARTRPGATCAEGGHSHANLAGCGGLRWANAV